MPIRFRPLLRRLCRRCAPSRLRVRRFVVAEQSMEPALVRGQGLIGVPGGRARVGQIRAFEHPDRPGFWLVKRVTAVSGCGDHAQMIVESDNSAAVGATDSNQFGPVDVAGSHRIVVTIPTRLM